MRVACLLVLLAIPFWHDTNSAASSSRGRTAYEAKKYAESVDAYRRAQELAPSARKAFNLGTAQIAAGAREEGSATLAPALQDPELRADAYFNRGNSALAAKANDHAIRDYIEALRASPSHAGAKRNLEIALQRREQQRRNASASSRENQQGKTPQKPQPSPAQAPKPRPGELDVEALLRSVQQQEQDELRRMKGKAGEAKVGW